MNLSASLRVNNEKGRKGKLAFTTTRSHVRDPNRCTLSPRLRLGTATTRDNRRKRCANTEHCAVAARGFKFDLASRRVFVSFRHSSRLSLASPLFFSKHGRVEYSIKSNGPSRKKKEKISHETQKRFPVYLNFSANFNRSIKSTCPIYGSTWINSLNKPRYRFTRASTRT